jgi:shikimate 5-dehydrogenase
MKLAVKRLLSNDPFKDLPETAVVLGGIIGGTQPSTYSYSPGLWNRFFEALGLKGKYVAFDLIRKDDLAELLTAALGFPGFLDLTVTKPYKALSFSLLKSLPFKTEISPRARALGSLNQLIRNPVSREIFVDRTDGWGFVRALKKHMPLAGKKVLLIGSGGTALSICYELICEGTELSIVDINADDAHRMGAVLNPIRKPGQKLIVNSNWDSLSNISASSDVIINAIVGVTPFEADAIKKLPENCLLADIHYNTGKAVFAHTVREAGRDCVDGLEMRYGQFRFAAERCGSMLGFSEESLEKHLDAIEEWFISSSREASKS